MKTISREELKLHLVGEKFDLPVVEVLSQERYQEFHLPGAINVPLDENFDQKIQEAVPQKDRPLVVYCGSSHCTASEKAAQRLEKLGYKEVLDYEGGKADWKEAGLPTACCSSEPETVGTRGCCS